VFVSLLRIMVLFGVALFGFGCAPSTNTPPPPAASPKPFESTKGKFKVQFPPGQVHDLTQEIDTPLGKQTAYIYAVDVRPGFGCLAGYSDYPEVALNTPAQHTLAGVRHGHANNGTILTDSEITCGTEKHPGREYVIEKPRNFWRYRTVLAGTRLYQLMVMGTREEITSKEADQFLDSFEITK
jgi:hypothetical protein